LFLEIVDGWTDGHTHAQTMDDGQWAITKAHLEHFVLKLAKNNNNNRFSAQICHQAAVKQKLVIIGVKYHNVILIQRFAIIYALIQQHAGCNKCQSKSYMNTYTLQQL